MALTVAFCQHLLEKAKEKHGEVEVDFPVYLAEAVAHVLKIIEGATQNVTDIATVDTLEIDDEWDFDDEDESIGNECEISNSQKTSQDWELMSHGNQDYSIDVIKKVVEFYDKRVTRKLQQTQRRFSFVTSYDLIKRFKHYLEQNGRKSDKLEKVEDHTLLKFKDARSSLACASERDLRRWSMQKARELHLDFKASRHWLHGFKKKHRIVSRQITKLTTRYEVLNQNDLMSSGKQFVENVTTLWAKVPSKNIWNFDQSGCNYEHSNRRTLSNKGEKETKMIVKSMNAVTHSHSIIPLISMSGKLAPKMLVCLQEAGGGFGPTVKSSLRIPNNIYLTSSKSGKLDKHIMKKRLNDTAPTLNPGESCVLLFDSWSGQTNASLFEDIPKIQSFHQIPPHTTQWIQPLDVYFFREYKIIRRKIFDRVMIEDNEIDLKQRQNTINMHALIYNQLQAPCFIPMLQYCWHACGYTTARPGYFQNVNEILFEVEGIQCDKSECENECFLKCSHCKSHLCLTHFLNRFHFHDVE